MDNIWEIALGYIQQKVLPFVYNDLFSKESIVKTERRGSLFYICVCDADHLTALKDFHMDEIEDALFIASGEHLKPIMVDYSCESIPTPSEQAQRPTSILDYGSVFNPRYTFDTFVVGSSNRFCPCGSYGCGRELKPHL